MARILPLLLALITSHVASAQSSQLIDYEWLNEPCDEMLHCDIGCSACNLPVGGSSVLFGTNMAFIGLSTCPLPITSGDNAVMTHGWSEQVSNDHYLLFSGIAGVPMTIDSLIINHTSATNGPTRLKVEFSNNAAGVLQEVADVQVPPTFDDHIFTDLGTIDFPEGAVMGSFQVRLTPYYGFGEGWAVNSVRVVATPVDQSAVGISEMYQNRTVNSVGPWFDVMGRPIGTEPSPGVYIGPTKRVCVF